jgi:hypothetical protein
LIPGINDHFAPEAELGYILVIRLTGLGGRDLFPQVKGNVEMVNFCWTGGALRKSRVIFLLGLAVMATVALSGRAQDGPPTGKNARCSWDPPTYGTPVHHYVLQVVELGGASPDTTTFGDITETFRDVWVTFGLTYKARVAGVDAENRQGPWSLWTPLYGPEWTPEDSGTAQN